MKLDTAAYHDVSQEQWDAWVATIEATSYHHSRAWLNYGNRFQNIVENRSFVCLDDNSRPLAVCPLMITNSGGFNEISINGAPLGVPALTDELGPGARRKLLDAIFGVIQDTARAYDAKRIVMITHPLTRGTCAGGISGLRYLFEPLRYRVLYRVVNTLVIDLSLPEETLLSEMGKYQRRHVTRGRRKGIEVKAFNSRENTAQLKHRFEEYQAAHLAAAGRMTRPQATWDAMYNIALDGQGSLFCAFLEDTVLSYLYCGEFATMAFGWSQANVKEYEKAYSPRHLLEWEAMMYYKRNGFRYYEVGERLYGPQLLHAPTEKEISISVFKERYGGFLLPKITWLGYYDREIMEKDFRANLDSYYSNDNLMRVPEGEG